MVRRLAGESKGKRKETAFLLRVRSMNPPPSPAPPPSAPCRFEQQMMERIADCRRVIGAAPPPSLRPRTPQTGADEIVTALPPRSGANHRTRSPNLSGDSLEEVYQARVHPLINSPIAPTSQQNGGSWDGDTSDHVRRYGDRLAVLQRLREKEEDTMMAQVTDDHEFLHASICTQLAVP